MVPAFLAVVAAFGIMVTILGFARELLLVLIVLALVDAMAAWSDILSQSLVQLLAPPELRGRAGGAWTLAIGTAPLGQLQIGMAASLYGVGMALLINGAALLALAAIGTFLFFPIRRRPGSE